MFISSLLLGCITWWIALHLISGMYIPILLWVVLVLCIVLFVWSIFNYIARLNKTNGKID